MLLDSADSAHSVATAAGQRHQAQAPSMGPAERWGGAHNHHRCLGSPRHPGRRGRQSQSLGHHHVRGPAVQGMLSCAGHAAACSMPGCAEHAAAQELHICTMLGGRLDMSIESAPEVRNSCSKPLPLAYRSGADMDMQMPVPIRGQHSICTC